MAATSVYLIVFRIVHVLSAIAWGGSVFLFVLYIQPSVAAIAPAGAPFMRELLGNRRMVDRIIMLASATIAGGLFLYWHDAGGFSGWADFLSTAPGAVLTIGAVSAIVAFVIGVFGTRPNVQRLLDLGARAAQAAEGGGPPPPEVMAEIQRVQGALKLFARASLGLIGVAALAMATWRYW